MAINNSGAATQFAYLVVAHDAAGFAARTTIIQTVCQRCRYSSALKRQGPLGGQHHQRGLMDSRLPRQSSTAPKS